MWDELKLYYTDTKGHPLLRKEIAKLHGVNKENVLVVVTNEGIYLAMNCLIEYLKQQNNNEPFHSISLFPAYQTLYENLKIHKCDLSYWNLMLEPNGWTFDMEELRKIIRPNTKLLVVNFPHNPTGYLPSREMWDELIALCKEKGIFLFCDEISSLTNNDGTQPNPSACSVYENSISLFGVTKSLALPGLRIGWLCTKNTKLFDMMSKFKDYLTICESAPSEILAIIALRNRSEIMKHTMGILCKNLAALGKFFAKHEDVFEWYPPRAGITAFVKVKGWLLNIGDGGATGFCDALRKEKGAVLLPAKMYDFKDEYVRLGFGHIDLEQCLVPLEEFLKEYKK